MGQRKAGPPRGRPAKNASQTIRIVQRRGRRGSVVLRIEIALNCTGAIALAAEIVKLCR